MSTVTTGAPRHEREEQLPAGRLGRPIEAERGKILWGYAAPFVLFHLLIPLAFFPWMFSWIGLVWLPVGNYLFCSLGIGGCYHRLLTHRGYQCPLWLEHTLAVLGVCCLQDSPARWVAIHRMHHQYSDEQPDPHTPLVNFFWSHMGWLLVENRKLSQMATFEKYARDILQDRFYLRIERNYMWAWIYLIHAVAFYLVGMTIGWVASGDYWHGVHVGLQWLFWGALMRTVYTWHVTWGINSIAHMFGYRNYATDENSRNNWLFALLTNGEGWHNNHHAEPRAAAHGHRWWELDVTYLTICLWERMGLAWNVVRPKKNGKPDPGALPW